MSNRLKNISFGIVAKENAGMHKIAKMLLTSPLNKDQIKMQALRYLITPHQLAQRQVNKYGWMSAVPKHLLNNETRQELATEISEIEKDTSITPYERVGKIVKAIKSKTNAPFFRDSAFKTMMNAKHNEYVLHDNLDDIHSVEDALRILREADVTAKPTTFIGAFPELFHENRLTNQSVTGSTRVWLGGQSHQAGLVTVADYVKSLWDIRSIKLRTSDKTTAEEMAKKLEKCWGTRNLAQAAGKQCIELMKEHTPEKVRHLTDDFEAGLPKNAGSFANLTDIEIIKAIITHAYENKLRLTGYFNNPLAAKAVSEMLKTGKVKTPTEKGQFQEFHKWAASQIDYDPLRGAVHRRDPLLNIIKTLKVDSASSYDTMLANMARYDFETRQPMIFAIDKILAIDKTNDDNTWRKEAATALKGASTSLFPSNLSHMTPNEAVRSETLEAVSRTMGGTADPDQPAKLWFTPGGRHAFFTPSGMPSIVGFPLGANDPQSRSLATPDAFNIWNGTDRKIRFREALLQYTQKDYDGFRSRHLPKEARNTIPGKKHIAKLPLTTSEFDTLTLASIRFAPRTLETQAQGFVQYAKVSLKQATTKLALEALEKMNFSSDELNAKNGMGNNAMHDALRLEAIENDYQSIQLGYALTEAFEKAGASYAAVNFYGVPLTELIPMAVTGDTKLEKHEERTRIARANAMSENLKTAMGSTEEPEDNTHHTHDAGMSL